MSISLPKNIFQNSCKGEGSLISSSDEIPEGLFREIMEVAAVDEKPREKEEERSEDKKKDEGLEAAFAALPPLSPLPAPPAASIAAPDKTTSPDFEMLFERMASQMIVMHAEGESETTLILDNPSSMFYGARITIREFSTAPKIFNVEIASSFQAAAAIEAGKNDLMSAFQNGHFNFSVHRLDTHIQSEDRPVLHRHEGGDSGSDEEQKGGRQQ